MIKCSEVVMLEGKIGYKLGLLHQIASQILNAMEKFLMKI